MLQFVIDEVVTESNEDEDFVLSLLTGGSLDTNLISIFIPEIWDFEESPFVVREPSGMVNMDEIYACKVVIAAFKEAPKVKFSKQSFVVTAFFNFEVYCDNIWNQTQLVVTFDTSAFIDTKLQFSRNVELTLEILDLRLELI